MKTQLDLIAHYHPRKEPKYWEAWQCGVCIGRDNSVRLLRHKVAGVKGVTIKCIR